MARSPLPAAATADARPRVIITADDFGLHEAVNEAVEHAHRAGVLDTASLMVAAPAAADAVVLARRLPALNVGLHLVLADGASLSPRAAIPDLVDAHGRFDARMAYAGLRFFALPHVRRQLATEIRAQFQAFSDTGLTLDHANAHKHFHLHPTVLSLMLSIGAEYGLKAVRLPHEPAHAACLAGRPPQARVRAGRLLLQPWLALLRRRLVRAGIAHNDHLYGLSATGAMTEATLLATLDGLTPGVSEIYLHPATRRGLTSSMIAYDHPGELAALVSPAVRQRFAAGAFRPTRFRDLGQV